MKGPACLLNFWLVSLGLFLNPVGSWAGSPPPVRVALSVDSRLVILSSSRPLILSFPGGRRISVSQSLTIRPVGGGLQINGEKFPVTVSRVSSRNAPLSLQIRGEKASEDDRRWEVRGSIVIHAQGNQFVVVNELDLETYVAGVVSSEINPDWHEEVLKAQAVAARTYVLHKTLLNEQPFFDVVASVQDQVYTGAAQVNGPVRDAVNATRGEVITFESRPIFAAYSSTAAGPTEDAFNVWAKDLPYLKGVDCPFDEESPRYRWEASIPLQMVEQRLRQEGLDLGSLATLAPYSYTRAGRVHEIRILHSRGTLIVRGQDLRRILGYSNLRSTQFQIESVGHEIIFTGKGAGHAVGLCQWGAKEMAELGYRYESILQYYYPGTDLLPYNQVNMSPLSSSS